MSTLRAASADDSPQVWAWNCAPDVRAVSRSTAAISPGDHERWYLTRLANDEAPFWIIVDGGSDVGVVRIDVQPDGEARISIALAADARGRGIGRRAIRAACTAWAKPVIAEIRATNPASRACFEACGFVATARRDELISYRWSP